MVVLCYALKELRFLKKERVETGSSSREQRGTPTVAPGPKAHEVWEEREKRKN